MIDMILGVIFPIPIGSIWRKLKESNNNNNGYIDNNKNLTSKMKVNIKDDINDNALFNSDGQRIN